MKKRKRIIIITIAVLILGISSVYAATLINSKDVLYDTSNSNGNSSNVQGALDELYSKIGDSCSIDGMVGTNNKNNLIRYITNLAKTDTTNLAYDDTGDKNLRYIGSNPNNYVLFNDELWRIIGVMKNVKDADGKSTSRVKIIRAQTYGQLSWDNQGASGQNDWSKSSLQTVLNNGPYWNRTSGNCPNGAYGATRTCDFSNSGLTEESKKMITKVIYNLGGHDTPQRTSSNIYVYERGTAVYSGRPTTWIGYVGLMYPSDYGFAVGGAVRETCLATNIYTYGSNNCYNNDWLSTGTYQIFMSPSSTSSYGISRLRPTGIVDSNAQSADGNMYIRPVVYLNTNMYRESGTGTSTDPYILTTTPIISDESNASPPKLDEEGKLIPVTLADNGEVTMVSEDDSAWYNYSEKQWANSVIFIDSPSKSYKVGDVIKEADIESYFVWIPKYKYKLWNTGTSSKNAHEIDIVFDTTDTVDKEGVSCKTPMTSGATGNCDNGEYMTHPAFISLGVDGFWVGKFETGYKGASSTSAAEVSSSDSSKIIVKPNVYSWRNNTVYNFFVSAYNYERNLDSHMMKSIEWGAVAYLSHSKYGTNKEVNINNNSSHKTGYGALPTTSQGTYPGAYGDGVSYNQSYNTEVGYLASTTGNITGIYDMSGGAHEYMASYRSATPGSSGFSTTTLANYNAKYFDVYNASSAVTTYQYRILGDATGEMGSIQNYKDGDGTARYHNSWYADSSYFVEATQPWFLRGGFYNHGVLSGQFLFAGYTGGVFTYVGSRIVLTG